MSTKIGVSVKTNGDLAKLRQQLLLLAGVEVLAGFPEDTTDREDAESVGITNASLAYIHDQGAPEQNIPARPFMDPAMESAAPKLEAKLSQVLKAVLRGEGADTVERGMQQVGMIAKLSIQNTINAGIDPALADSTLRARARKGRNGAQEELNRRAKGEAPSTAFAKPLVDTGELRNAASYAIRKRNQRK